jgi:RND family efflux transporter MFP subunit
VSPVHRSLRFLFVAGLAAAAAGCRADAGASAAAADPAAIAVSTVAVEAVPIARYIRVSGTLAAEESAEVAAEIAGRVVATPVERGSRVVSGGELVRISAAEVEAQAREAQANAAQIEARLGIAGGKTFEVARVPEVASAAASRQLARTDFTRAQTLHAAKLVAQSEFDQRRAQLESAERQYDVAVNGAEQQYQSLMAARARVTVAQKALADTVVRAPFTGVVGERLVSAGDYVTRGTKVASVMRVDPLRVELTVPEQYVSAVDAGRAVTFEVDAYPGETFTGQVRYVSPSVNAETRALTVEAVVANPSGRLKPGFFATARIDQAAAQPGLLVPATAVRTVSGTARVFVVTGDRAEERIVMTGQTVGDRIELTDGVTPGERVVASGIDALADGVRVQVR